MTCSWYADRLWNLYVGFEGWGEWPRNGGERIADKPSSKIMNVLAVAYSKSCHPIHDRCLNKSLRPQAKLCKKMPAPNASASRQCLLIWVSLILWLAYDTPFESVPSCGVHFSTSVINQASCPCSCHSTKKLWLLLIVWTKHSGHLDHALLLETRSSSSGFLVLLYFSHGLLAFCQYPNASHLQSSFSCLEQYPIHSWPSPIVERNSFEKEHWKLDWAAQTHLLSNIVLLPCWIWGLPSSWTIPSIYDRLFFSISLSASCLTLENSTMSPFTIGLPCHTSGSWSFGTKFSNCLWKWAGLPLPGSCTLEHWASFQLCPSRRADQ